MGELATKVNEIDQRTTNSLPGNTILNPREECKAITLISGHVSSIEAQVNEEPIEKEAPEEKKEEVEHTPPKRADNPFPDSLDTYPTLPKAPEYKPKMPYPQRDFKRRPRTSSFQSFWKSSESCKSIFLLMRFWSKYLSMSST